MSQVKLTLRPRPNSDFVHGYPGIPPGGPDRPQAAVEGTIEVRAGLRGVKVKWLRIELRKVEMLPGGTPNEFYDSVGPGPVDLATWDGEDEYGLLCSEDFPFSIRIPESIPPSIGLDNLAGIQYELVASLYTEGEKGSLRKRNWVVVSTQTAIIIDKHELHSTWPLYNQPESRQVLQDGCALVVYRNQTCYGPGDRISVMALFRSDTLDHSILRRFEFALIETTVFRMGPSLRKNNWASEVEIAVTSDSKLVMDAPLYAGVEHPAELTYSISPNHTTTSLNTARHIDITYVLSVKAIVDQRPPIVLDLPVVVSNWQRTVSREVMSRIGPVPTLSLLSISPIEQLDKQWVYDAAIAKLKKVQDNVASVSTPDAGSLAPSPSIKQPTKAAELYSQAMARVQKTKRQQSANASPQKSPPEVLVPYLTVEQEKERYQEAKTAVKRAQNGSAYQNFFLGIQEAASSSSSVPYEEQDTAVLALPNEGRLPAPNGTTPSVSTQALNASASHPAPSQPPFHSATTRLPPSSGQSPESTPGPSTSRGSTLTEAQAMASLRAQFRVLDIASVNTATKIDALVATLEVLFADREKYKQLLACRDSSAQKLLDMFQRLLDILENPKSSFRRDLIVAMQRLAGKSGLYPACYELGDITSVGDYPESSGAFADIYQGTLQGRAVCLKTIRLDMKTEIQHFLKVCSKEAILWGQLSHPNIVPFYGMYRFRRRVSLVAPWMNQGDVNNYLQNHQFADRIRLVFNVAEGLQFLHENGIIHGDLKGPNILVDDSGIACLTDFGISSISDSKILAWTSHSSVASKGGSVRWQAPELFDPDGDEDVHNTVASDIYAWSCVAYEIFTEHVPFKHLSRDTAVSHRVRLGERPARPHTQSPSWNAWGLTETIWSLMEECWKTNPVERPAVHEIIERLLTVLLKPPDITHEGLRGPMSMKESSHVEDNGSNYGDEMDGRGSTLPPARFREMARKRLNQEEMDMSVEAFESLLHSG